MLHDVECSVAVSSHAVHDCDISKHASVSLPVDINRLHFPASAGQIDPAHYLSEEQAQEFRNPMLRVLSPQPPAE
eukprot:4868351-Karenia_brevis.AAC.1